MGAKQRLLTWSVLSVCAAVTLATVCGLRDCVASAVPILKRTVITVDAGHGGFDGGAVAADGTQEKTLNLEIATELADLLRFCGYDVRMTREEDRALSEEKREDMKARLAMFEQADFNISIHQNMFNVSKYHGAQVFYSNNNPLSKRLAVSMREAIRTYLQPDNEREIKAGDNAIYLLYKTTRPTVLVECGFLSNPEELQALQTPSYRHKISFALCCGVMGYGSSDTLDSGNEE